MLGGVPGGQAQYLRVPYGDVGPIKIPDGVTDKQVLFLSDIFPTGYMAAENAQIQKGDTVAVWGCGPAGQFAIKSAWMFGAGRVIAIDGVPERLAMARGWGKAEIIDNTKEHVQERLMEMTHGQGPDSCIDAVSTEAHTSGALDAVVDRAKEAVKLGTDRPHVLRETIMCCRKGGTLSIPGVYIGFLDKVPFGALMNKGLTVKTGQTHMHRYLQLLLNRIESGENRSVLRNHSQSQPGGCSQDVQDLPRQRGRLHQGRIETSSGVTTIALAEEEGFDHPQPLDSA
jgi:threonine dehydrogenase-like Zn-dependent dehydrogenase